MADAPSMETETLLAEIHRLKAQFGANPLLARQIDELLFAWQLSKGSAPAEVDFLSMARACPVSFKVRATIGHRISTVGTLDADGALACLLITRRQTDVVSQPGFTELLGRFRRLFDQKFAGGMALDGSGVAKLPPYIFYSGSATFEVELEGRYRQWPDVAKMTPRHVSAALPIFRKAWI
jgi:hypothetical protein